jgi:hypothetical protein
VVHVWVAGVGRTIVKRWDGGCQWEV